MLWFDNDPRADIITKISRAMEYYQKKYGQRPTLIYIHPDTKGNSPLKAAGVDIKTDQMVLPDHFWLGMKGFSNQGSIFLNPGKKPQ